MKIKSRQRMGPMGTRLPWTLKKTLKILYIKGLSGYRLAHYGYKNSSGGNVEETKEC